MEASIFVETDTEHPNQTTVKIEFFHNVEECISLGQLKKMVHELTKPFDNKTSNG